MTFCGCWFVVPGPYRPQQKFLPSVGLESKTTILTTTSRTVLTQKFFNPVNDLDEVQYTFPLYDGVSVVGFKCTVGTRTIVGVVKEKQQARAEYKEAIERGETAGLLEQLPQASDCFTTRVGNVPKNGHVIVEIVYLGELKHDAETDGSRFTIPTFIAPRYGGLAVDTSNLPKSSLPATDKSGIRILVDVEVEESSPIRGLQSPSHPIAVEIGRLSTSGEDAFSNHHASAALTLGSTELDKDFIIVVLAKGQDTPRAMLEYHPSIHGHRALMTTLVPKFSIPQIHPEIVFVVDRSGSMGGKIITVVAALKIFLKSLPVGVKFNICSFGSKYEFMWAKSQPYNQSTLQKALDHLETFGANFGGTEMFSAIQATVKNRFKDMPLEVMVITDGEIWNQQQLFDFINKAADQSARFFSLGIGAGASSSLVEGIATAGDGFAQFVAEGEKMDKRVVRMLKGALTPHIKNYSLEVKYGKEDDEDFEIIEKISDCMKGLTTQQPSRANPVKKVISLFDKSAKEEPTNPAAGPYDHLPAIAVPKLLQAPHKIPPLYPFSRTTVYLLMSPDACQLAPKAVVLRGQSEHGPLELEIPVQDIGTSDTIHQLAAKKAVHELEQGRGWITEAKDSEGKPIKDKNQGRWDEIVEREAVRLGVQFQVGGKWCSFVAVEANSETDEKNGREWPREPVDRPSAKSKSGFPVNFRSSQSPPHVQSLFAMSQPRSPRFFAGGNLKPDGTGGSRGQLQPPGGWNSIFGSASGQGTALAGSASPLHPVLAFPSGVPTPFSSIGANPFGAAHAPTATGQEAGLLSDCIDFSEDDSEAFESFNFDSFQQEDPPIKNVPATGYAEGTSGQALSLLSTQPPTPHRAQSAPTADLLDNTGLSGSTERSGSPRLSQGGSARYRRAPVQENWVESGDGMNWSQQPYTTYDCRQAHSLTLKKSRSMAPQGPPPAPAGAPKAKRTLFSGKALRRSAPPARREVHCAVLADSDGVDEVMVNIDGGGGKAKEESTPAAKPQTDDERMHALIALQMFDGHWELDQAFVDVLGPMVATGAGPDVKVQVTATVYAVAWLRAVMQGEHETWEMVVEKAMGWLRGETGRDCDEDVEELRDRIAAA